VGTRWLCRFAANRAITDFQERDSLTKSGAATRNCAHTGTHVRLRLLRGLLA